MAAWFTLLLLFQQPSLIDQAEDAFRNDDLARAAQLARRAVAQQPGLTAGHMILGIIAARNREWAGAGQRFQTVVRLDPSDPNGHFYLGQARLYQRQWQTAAQSLQKALSLGFPDKERLLVELAYAENESGKPQQALAGLQGVPPPSSPGPARAQYFAVTGFAHARLGHLREAIDAIERARDSDPANSHYWELLITSLIGTDQTQRALREAIVAQSRFPDDPEIQYLFVLSNYYVPESPLSRLALRNLKEAEPASPRVLLAEGMLHRKQAHDELATAAFVKAAAAGVPDAHLLLGIVRKENGDFAAAEREYRLAETSNPFNGQVHLELGKLSLARGNATEAVARLRKAEALMPDTASVHYQLGLALTRLGRSEEAERHIARSRELDRRQAELQK